MMTETLIHSIQGAFAEPVLLMVGTLLKSSLLLLIAATITTVARGLSAAERHLIWTVSLVGALALPLLTVLSPRLEVPVPIATTSAPAVVESVAPQIEPMLSGGSNVPSAELAPAPVAPVARGRAGASGTVAPAPRSAVEATSVPAIAPVDPAIAPAAQARSVETPVLSWARIAEWVPLALVLSWSAGALLVLTTMLVGLVRLRLLELRTPHTGSERLLDNVNRLAQEMELPRTPRILIGGDDAIPMTWGAFRPRLLLPAVAERWSDTRLRDVLVHEFAHVRRRDYLTQMVAQFACALYWCNPLVWYAAHRLRIEREHACDDLVVRSGTEPTRYADTLLEFARSLHTGPSAHAAALAMARPNQLRARLVAVLDQARSRRPLRAARVLATTATALPLVIAIAAATPVAADAPDPTLEEASGSTSIAMSAATADDHVVPASGVAVGPENRGADHPTELHPSGLHSPLPDHPEVVGAFGGSDGSEMLLHGEMAPHGGIAWGSEATSGPATGSLDLLTPSASASWAARQEATLLCGPADGKHHRSAHQTNDDRITVDHHYGDCRSFVEIHGDIDFNSDFTRISRLERRASLTIDVRRPGVRYELGVEPGTGGTPEYEWRVNGDESPFDSQAQAWLDGVIVELLRSTTYKARERAAWIMDERGIEGLVDELEFLRGDHLQGHYLSIALEDRQLSQGEVRTVLAAAGRHLESDHQLGRVLISTAQRYALDEGARGEFLQAATSLESDHQQGKVFEQALRWNDLSGAEMQLLLETAAASIESDHTLGGILMGLTERYTLSPALRPHFLRAAATIDSDHQKGGVYGALLATGDLSSSELADVLDAAQGIESDHQLGELLRTVAQQGLSDPTLRSSFLDAARTIGPDHQLGSVLTTALQLDGLSEAEKADVLEAARSIDSDHELSSVLIQSARTGLEGATSQRIFLEAASGLGDHNLQSSLQAFMEGADAGQEEQLMLLRTARRISSDHALASVLTRFLDTYPVQGEVEAAFERALDGIGSEHQRQSVTRQLDRRR